MIQHILPTNDLREHSHDSGIPCNCDPRIEILENGDMLIIHNSYDGREGLEMAEALLK